MSFPNIYAVPLVGDSSPDNIRKKLSFSLQKWINDLFNILYRTITHETNYVFNHIQLESTGEVQ